MIEPSEDSIASSMSVIEQNAGYISLTASDLAFLAGIELWARSGSGIKLSEGELCQIFAALDEKNPSDTRDYRANLAIRKILEQRLLNRISSSADSEGSYRLSYLGQAIASDLIRKESLSKETLETMLSSIAKLLSGIVDLALTGGDEFHWKSQVEAPLKNTVGLLVEVLDQRQRTLDAKQIETQYKFEDLYGNDDSIAGIYKCEQLLSSVANTLKELDRALLQGAGILKSKLYQIEEAAEQAEALTCRDCARFIYQGLDDMVEWAMIRGDKWTEYYQSAHEFLRSSVSLDSNRAFSHRLRHEIGKFHERPWFLMVLQAEPWRSLREDEEVKQAQRISRAIQSTEVQTIAPGSDLKLHLSELKETIAQKLRKGESVNLIDMVSPFKEDSELLYQVALCTIAELAREGIVENKGYRPEWKKIVNNVEIQELIVSSKLINANLEAK
jgi:chromosome partition protein MukF